MPEALIRSYPSKRPLSLTMSLNKHPVGSRRLRGGLRGQHWYARHLFATFAKYLFIDMDVYHGKASLRGAACMICGSLIYVRPTVRSRILAALVCLIRLDASRAMRPNAQTHPNITEG